MSNIINIDDHRIPTDADEREYLKRGDIERINRKEMEQQHEEYFSGKTTTFFEQHRNELEDEMLIIRVLADMGYSDKYIRSIS